MGHEIIEGTIKGLVDVHGLGIPLKSVFCKKVEGRVFAKWYTGEIWLMNRSIADSQVIANSPVGEPYIVVTVEKGEVVGERME